MTYEPPALPPSAGGTYGGEPRPEILASSHAWGGAPLPSAEVPPPGFEGMPRRPRRTGLIVAVVAVVVVVGGGCLTGGFFAVRQAGQVTASASPPPITRGGCVKPGSAGGYRGTPCEDPNRTDEVLGVIDGDQEAAQSCDPATDQLIVHWPQVICARHVGGRHVSAAGLGGGVLVPGDCVHLTLEMLLPDPTEVPCTDPGYQAKVISRVGTAAECTAPAVHYEKLATDRGPVLCLATGPGIAGPSQCLHAENSAVHYAPVPCTDGQATHRVLARTASDAACPPGTTSYTEDAGGLPSTKIVCLHELKTHGIDN